MAAPSTTDRPARNVKKWRVKFWRLLTHSPVFTRQNFPLYGTLLHVRVTIDSREDNAYELETISLTFYQ